VKTASTKGPQAGQPLGAWNRFWFQPTDPTTLGFMRIIVGLVVIYVHLAYCFDLQAFFGPDGYWNQAIANRERKEFPVRTDTWKWEPVEQPLPTPQLVDRRVAVFDFLKHLPEDKKERDAALQYLYFLIDDFGTRGQPEPERNFQTGLLLLKKVIPLLDSDVKKIEDTLAKEPLDATKLPITLPDFFLTARGPNKNEGGKSKTKEDARILEPTDNARANLIEALTQPAEGPQPPTRLEIWSDLLRFAKFTPAAEMNLDYVISWMADMSVDERVQLRDFLKDLPSGPAGQQILEYLETWRQDPRLNFDQGRYIFSLWFHVSSPATMWTFHFLFIGIYVLFTIGFFTRVTSVLTWLATLFYMHRTQQVLFGMDTMMNILLFYMMIGPSGAALSVDRLIARYRASRALLNARGHSVPWAETELAGPRPSSLANFTVRLFQIHFCFIYMASGLAKLKGTTWWNQNAAWSVIANPEFCPVQYRQYEWLLHQIAAIKPLMAVFFASVVYFTLIMEIGLPFLIWTRLRPVMVIGAVFLHTGIAWVMGLTCFGLLMLTLLLCYVPAATIRERVAWPPGTGPKMTLRFSSRNSRHRRLASFLRALDLTGQIAFQDEPAKTAEVQLIDESGKTYTSFTVVQQALRTLVFGNKFAWLLWVPGVGLLMRTLMVDESRTIDHVGTTPLTSAKTPAGS
jgi:hypothetical protein